MIIKFLVMLTATLSLSIPCFANAPVQTEEPKMHEGSAADTQAVVNQKNAVQDLVARQAADDKGEKEGDTGWDPETEYQLGDVEIAGEWFYVEKDGEDGIVTARSFTWGSNGERLFVSAPPVVAAPTVPENWHILRKDEPAGGNPRYWYRVLPRGGFAMLEGSVTTTWPTSQTMVVTTHNPDGSRTEEHYTFGPVGITQTVWNPVTGQQVRKLVGTIDKRTYDPAGVLIAQEIGDYDD